MTADDLPNCPLCGKRLVPVILKTNGTSLAALMCDCQNVAEAEQLQGAREHGSVLYIDFDEVMSMCNLQCEDCLFAMTCKAAANPLLN